MTARNLEAKHDKLLKELLRKPENKRCANCEVLGPQYVVLDFTTFVCTDCSGAHRQFHHRVKGISMATFKPEEMKQLQQGGNQEAAAAYLSKWTPSEMAKPTDRNPQKIRDWIDAVYVKKRYFGPKKLQRPSPSPSTGTLSARSSARSTRDDDIPTRSMADILGNDSVRLQISPATSTTSNTPSLLDPTPLAAPSPAAAPRTAPPATDPFGIGTSDAGAPTGGSSQTNWSPFNSVDSSSSQALQPSAATGPAAYAPPGAPAWSAFDANGGPSGGPQQQANVGQQQQGGASWDPFSASGPPTATPPQQSSGPAPTQPPQQQPQQQQQLSLMEAVQLAERRSVQAASQQQPQRQLQPTAAGAGGSWQAFGAPAGPANGQPGPQASAGGPAGQASMKELPLDLFAEPTPRGIPGYNHPARGGYAAQQAGYSGSFPGAQQGFPGGYPGFPGGQQQFPGMQQQPQGMFPYGQGMMTPNGLMQPRPGMPPQGIPGVQGHMMPQAGFPGYAPQPGMPNSLLPSGPSHSGFGGTPGMFPAQNGFPGQSNHPGGFPQQPGGFPGQAGFPGQQQQMAGYGGPLSNSITGEYRGQFPPGTPGGPPPGINPAGPETMDPFSGLVPGLKSALPNPSASPAAQNAAAAGLQPSPTSFGGLSNGPSGQTSGGQFGAYGGSQAGPAGSGYPGASSSMPLQQSSQQQQQYASGPSGFSAAQPQRPPQQQPSAAFGLGPSMSPLANGPTAGGPTGKWATQHPYGLNPQQQGSQQPQQMPGYSQAPSAQLGSSSMGPSGNPQQGGASATQSGRVPIPQIPVGGPSQQFAPQPPSQQSQQQQQDPDYDPFSFVPSASTLATASPKKGPQPQSAQSPKAQPVPTSNPSARPAAAPTQAPTPSPAPTADLLSTSAAPSANGPAPPKPSPATPPAADLLGASSNRGAPPQAASPLPDMFSGMAAAPALSSGPATQPAAPAAAPTADLLGGSSKPAATPPKAATPPALPDDFFSGMGGATPAAAPAAAASANPTAPSSQAFPSQAAPPASSGNPFG